MTAPSESPPSPTSPPIRLHIGGTQPHPDWKILDVTKRAQVDFIGNCTDLSQFADNSIAAVYASHVYEHLAYRAELPHALAEVYRVLISGGIFCLGVPDLEALARLYVHPSARPEHRFQLMQMILGGQTD